jgi:hypothetical protein
MLTSVNFPHPTYFKKFLPKSAGPLVHRLFCPPGSRRAEAGIIGHRYTEILVHQLVHRTGALDRLSCAYSLELVENKELSYRTRSKSVPIVRRFGGPVCAGIQINENSGGSI